MEQRRMCPNCRAFITIHDKVCPYCETRLAPRAAERTRGDSTGAFDTGRFTTMILLLINFGLYAATTIYDMKMAGGVAFDITGRTLFEFGAKYPEAIFAGQWWRLLTAGFLHGGILHILMNSWALFGIGGQVEELYGSARYLIIYFVATIVGFIASTLFSPALSVGASAAIYGMIGAMIAYGMRMKSSVGDAIKAHYTQWLIFGVIMAFFPGIDNWAHGGGFIGGFASAYIVGAPGLVRKWTESLWKTVAAVCVVLGAASFGLMFLSFAAG